MLEVEIAPASTDTQPPDRPDVSPTREIRHEYTHSLPPLLSQLGVSLLVSTYQAGKVAAVGVAAGELTLSYHNFERAMGLAVKPDGIAVAARAQVWFLHAAPDLAAHIEPAGRHDACFLTRNSHFTGEVQAHELSWAGDELWLVNTAFGCLCTLDGRHSFVPRWRPPFLTALAADDRCHLNGLAMADGVPKYVTALAETDTPQGWRANKVRSGCLIDVASGQTVARGFAMPHSPRVHQGRVWMLHSGAGQLVLIDPASGTVQTVTELPGYTRGLALYDRFAFVGLSKIRETSTFGGMPISERRPELKCGVGVVDLTTGRLVAHLEFVTGVEEIFDVQVVQGARCPALSGPYAGLDNAAPIWTVPEPASSSKQT
ncbi:MAG TPA: TIGR03032 family protein [Pirellulales bacterium]